MAGKNLPVQFTADAAVGLADGSITRTYRRWKRAQAKVGGVYRPWGVSIQVTAIGQLRAGTLTDDDAHAAGAPDRDTLLDRLGRPADTEELWRIDFHRIDDPDPRVALRVDADLDAAAIADIDRRLDRLDRASTFGPWTRATLVVIGDHPAVVSSELATLLDRDRAVLKVDIRKLKALGLTESLETGYRLSPRGMAYVAGVGGSGGSGSGGSGGAPGGSTDAGPSSGGSAGGGAKAASSDAGAGADA